VWEIKEGRVMEGVKWAKIKYTYSTHTLETPLNTNLNINNEKHCKIGAVFVLGGTSERGNGE
jgi:hypothetical protein